jgi:ribosomal protein L24
MRVKIRKGDTVEIISGRLEDKGKRGEVINVFPDNIEINNSGHIPKELKITDLKKEKHQAITRSDYARAISNLSRAGARLIAVDMDLSKTFYSDDQIQELEAVVGQITPLLQGRKKPADKKKPISDAVSRVVQEPDAKLADALGTAGNVILIRFVDGGKWVAPLPKFQNKALSQGAINFSVDRDGKIRRDTIDGRVVARLESHEQVRVMNGTDR